MVAGIVQSIIIVRILSVGEYGLVTLAMSIGGAFGVYQNLGLTSGSTREISSADSKQEIFKIFITSTVIRYLMSIPLAFVLLFFSYEIAVNQYGSPELVAPLKIFALVLLIQGVQGIFNSVMSGMQRFRQLFVYQVAIAFVGVLLYVPLVYLFKVDGYFYALALFNILATIWLGVMAMGPLKGEFVLPNREDFKRLFKEILSISLAIYAVKIIYTYWQKSGPLLLGLDYSAEAVGLFGFALLYAGKLMTVSDSITDVNLPVLSKKFVTNVEEFKQLFSQNFDKVFAFIVLAATTAVFWVQDIFNILIGDNKYDDAVPFVMPLVFAFVFYSIVNIVKSSIFVPAKYVKEMIIAFLLMLFSTAGFYFMFDYMLGGLVSMSYAMVVGSLVGLLALSLFSFFKLKFTFLNSKHFVLVLVGFLLSTRIYNEFSIEKILVFGLGAILYIGLVLVFKIVKTSEIQFILRKLPWVREH